jgi:hypothetical protein
LQCDTNLNQKFSDTKLQDVLQHVCVWTIFFPCKQ